MGLFQLLLLCVGAVLVIGAAIWVINYLSPDHPKIIDKGLWVLAVVIVFTAIFLALGGHDIRVPKVF